MSPKPPRQRKPAGNEAFNFPALRQFFRGYFHQDWVEEYGSVEEATRQFCEDATTPERQQVATQWELFLQQHQNQPLDEINRILSHHMGGACRLTDASELRQISEVFQQHLRRQ
jgi:hypothetical protein